VPKFSLNFEGILLRAHGHFEEQNKVLELSIVIIYYLLLLLMHIIIIIV